MPCKDLLFPLSQSGTKTFELIVAPFISPFSLYVSKKMSLHCPSIRDLSCTYMYRRQELSGLFVDTTQSVQGNCRTVLNVCLTLNHQCFDFTDGFKHSCFVLNNIIIINTSNSKFWDYTNNQMIHVCILSSTPPGNSVLFVLNWKGLEIYD